MGKGKNRRNRGKSGKSRNKSSQKKGRYLKVANVWKSKEYEGQRYVQCDDYFGDLFFREKKSGKVFKVNYMNLFKPKPYENKDGDEIVPPENLVYNVTVNLNNKEVLELVEADSDDDDHKNSTSDDDDEEEQSGSDEDDE